jgi:hypothetical protein
MWRRKSHWAGVRLGTLNDPFLVDYHCLYHNRLTRLHNEGFLVDAYVLSLDSSTVTQRTAHAITSPVYFKTT